MRILIAISGGIAAYKVPKIVTLLRDSGHEVRVIATKNSLRFVSELTLAALTGQRVLSDLWEGGGDYEMSHIRLPEWCELLLVVPASADLLGKVGNGLADDLVSTTLLAAGSGERAVCPIVYAPAMNSRMWEHQAVQANISKIEERGGKVIPPIIGKLACTDHGTGRLPEPEEILAKLVEWELLS